MSNKLKDCASLLITVFTLFAFVLPIFGSVAHAESQATICSAQADCSKTTSVKAETSKHESKSEKANCDCCIAHHCCASKLIMLNGVVLAARQMTAAVLITHKNQVAFGFGPVSLDRPPKDLA